jgi:hypothetical protein
MSIKSATRWALAATSLTAIAAIPAVAQMAPYGSPGIPPPAYQGNAYPNPPAGTYGAPSGTSSSGNYAPQTDQGVNSPSWSQGNNGSTSGTTTAPSNAGTTVMAEPPARTDPGERIFLSRCVARIRESCSGVFHFGSNNLTK